MLASPRTQTACCCFHCFLTSHIPDSYLDLYMLTQCLIVAHHFSWPLAHFMSSQLSHLLITASDSLLFVEFAKTDSVDQRSQHFEHSLQ